MNRIENLFQSEAQALLSIYFCAGSSSAYKTVDVIRALEKNGVSMVEIGIPFSDPMADGAVIQQASTQALRHGMSIRRLFTELADVRGEVGIPLVLMGYLNPIMQFGIEAFFQSCAACGIDGVIIPDLPFSEYQKEFQPLAEKYHVHVIMLITPETEPERIREIDAHTKGFIYLVSSAATTGSQEQFDDKRIAYFKEVKAMNLQNPCMIGFGISNKVTFDTACQHASGAIIGSRFVTLLQETQNPEVAIQKLKELIGQ
ncbi:MAG: tryptophan synthase subunit alpha [Bacteroidia bacterium]|nr:tryptophan synthase subunit alpha [Bacteroidia bacterium]